MRHVLVTGGAGFIGSHLVDALVARGDQVRVLDNFSTGKAEYLAAVASRIEIVRGDVQDADAVYRAMDGITHVVHTAAIRSIPLSLENPRLCNQVNVEGTLNVFVAAQAAGARRVVFASSSAVYDAAGVGAISETQPPHPASPYGVTKLAGEWYAQLYRELYGLEIVCLRYFTVFGPRMDGESGYAMAIPRFVTALLRGEPLPIYGDGQQRRDFLYIENAVAVALQALECRDLGPAVFNVGGGRDYSLLELVGMLNRQLGTQTALRHLPPRVGEARQTLADISRAAQILNYRPAVSCEEGLARTVAWFRGRVAPPPGGRVS